MMSFNFSRVASAARARAAAFCAALVPALFAAAVHAQEESAAAYAPAEQVHIAFVILFGVIFFGMIAGFFAFVWRADRKQRASAAPDDTGGA